MKRKDFLRNAALAGLGLAIPTKNSAYTPACNTTPEETEGPFPTHQPSQLVAQNIVAGKKGTPLDIALTIYNINDNCRGFGNATVDIWHCDSQGEYSEYGGNDEHGFGGGPGMPPPPPHPREGKRMPPPPVGGGSMQTADHKNEHFLRGRQTTNNKGEVSFHSIFPGWYPSRAPHVHVHIYDATGKSLLVTQIAFPEEVCTTVYTQGEYAAHGLPETTNENDNVFGDGLANEMGTITGNPKDGYVLRHSIYVKGSLR